MGDQHQDDRDLAARFGAYAGFTTDAAPTRVVYDAGSPAEDIGRLLRHHARVGSHFLDIGCGAGHTLCRLAPHVREAWGFEQDRALLAATRRRASHLRLPNVTCVAGDIRESTEVAQLPDNHFDLALSQRGPNLNASLARTLRPDAIFIQELVSEFDGYPFHEMVGNRSPAPYSTAGGDALVRHYMEMGLFPIGLREYFYEEYFRDGDHLASYLGELGPVRWPQASPTDESRRAFTTYVREHTTPSGVRFLRHRRVFILRCNRPISYPSLTV